MSIDYRCDYYWQQRCFELVDTADDLNRLQAIYYAEPSMKKEVCSRLYAEKMEDKWKRVYELYTKRAE